MNTNSNIEDYFKNFESELSHSELLELENIEKLNTETETKNIKINEEFFEKIDLMKLELASQVEKKSYIELGHIMEMNNW